MDFHGFFDWLAGSYVGRCLIELLIGYLVRCWWSFIGIVDLLSGGIH